MRPGNGLSHLLSSLNGQGEGPSYEYDEAGWQTLTTDGTGATTQLFYDAAGRATKSIDAEGFTWLQGFDPAGKLTASTDPNGNSTSQHYDRAGYVTALVDGGGNTTLQEYDLSGLLTWTGLPSGNTLGQTYDGVGRVLSRSEAAGGTTSYAYDAAGNRTEVTDPDGRTTGSQYDRSGYQTAAIDAGGHSTTLVYDLAGRQTLVLDPEGNSTTQTYDGAGHRLSQSDADGGTNFEYDLGGYKTAAFAADGSTILYAYDGEGRELSQDWYDSGGSPVDSIGKSYDGLGRLLSASDGDSAYDFEYDPGGRLTRVQGPWGVTLTMGYDGAGLRTSLSDSLGNSESSSYTDTLLTQRNYSGSGASVQVDLEYNSIGQMTLVSRYDGGLVATSEYTYGTVGHITHIVTEDATTATIDDFAAIYSGGDVTTRIDNGVTTTFSYDGGGQLTGENGTSYSYDDNGNRDGVNDYVGPVNQLLSDGTWDYEYDQKGNLSQKTLISSGEVWNYEYDNANQLTRAAFWTADPDDPMSGATLQKAADYLYDAFGNRLAKEVDGDGNSSVDATERYVLDGWNPAKPSPLGNENFDVIADLDGSNDLVRSYVRGDKVDQILARVEASGDALWLITDHLGSVRDVIDDSAVSLVTISYDAFGNILGSPDLDDVGRYAWTGREFDVETDLQYNRARYYDSFTGRWLSKDPLGFDAGDSNLYRYASNRVTSATDPSGLQEPAGTFGGVFKGDPQWANKWSNRPIRTVEDFVVGMAPAAAVAAAPYVLTAGGLKVMAGGAAALAMPGCGSKPAPVPIILPTVAPGPVVNQPGLVDGLFGYGHPNGEGTWPAIKMRWDVLGGKNVSHAAGWP